MFTIGNQYSKKDIYQILNVPIEIQDGAWDTGYRKYKGSIYLFCNIGVSGRTGHDYDNHWNDDGDLEWYAKPNTHIDQPLIKDMLNENTLTYIFTRTNNYDPFTFQGLGKGKSFEKVNPFKIVWELSN